MNKNDTKSTTFQKSTLRKKPKQNAEIEKNDEYNFIHSYGEIHFPGCEEPVKYIRTDQRNTQEQWKRILAEKWNLKPPTLIISILSSHAELTKRFKSTLKKGLWKAAEGSGCWIITDGFDHGMTKVAGEAVRDYTEAYGSDHMIMVGVAHTERVTYQELFDLANHAIKSKDISSNVLYPDPLSDEETDDITNTATTSMEPDLWQFNESGQQIDNSAIKLSNKSLTKTYRLNSNHQFLILIDPILKQEQTLEDRLLETRVLLERTIITWAKEQKFKNTEKSLLPIITVTPRPSATLPSLGDGLVGQTIRRQSHLYTCSQIEKKTGVKDLFQKNELNENQLVDKEINILQNISQDELNSTSQTTARVPICGIVGGGNTATLDQIYASVTLNRCPMVLVRGTGGVADILSNVLDFMSFRNTLEETFTDQEIDYKIASIIQEVHEDARSNKRGRPLKKSDKSTKNNEKSTTNITINLPTDNSGKPSTTRTEQITNTMINIKEYESQVYRIKELADDYAHLFSIFEYDDIDLDDIGRIIKNLLGDFYHPFYLSKRFQHSVVEHGYCESSDDEATNDNLYDDYEKQPGKIITSTSTLKAVEPIPLSFNVDEKSDAEKSEDHNVDHEGNTVQSEQMSQSHKHSRKPEKNGKSKQKLNQQRANEKSEDTEDITSYTSSNNSSETKLIKSSRHQTKSRRSVSADTKREFSDDRSSRSKKSAVNNNVQVSSSSINRRRYIVKPIVGTNNSRNYYYQNDYYSYSDNYENDQNGVMNGTIMGKKRLITTSQHSNDTHNFVPKAQEDSFPDRSFCITNEKKLSGNSNGLISSYQENATVNIIVQSHSSIQSSKTEVSVVTDPTIIDDQTSDHLHYQQQPQNVTGSHDQSISSICQTTTLSKQISSNRNNKFPVQRVAHSILHPLTDPEKARLRLREIERQTLERKREKERKRRHRIAQEKFTIMERLTGQAKAEHFRHTSTVKFDRPARELMMMCILLGRFEMAEIFWNQEKEPIAAALVLSIIIAELGQKSDDVANKEEYEENARSFEDKADQVLEECYQEDRARTLILLYRKLEFYGNTSVIRLAARGKCIRFMANPCCQDLLSGVWSGRLSPKNTWIQLVPAIIMGISIPFIIPQFIKYSTSFESGNSPIGQTKIDQDENKSRTEVEKLVKPQRQSIHLDKPITLGTRISSQIERIQIFYQAPIIRFVYNTSSFKEYINDGWNKLDCLAISLYIIGLSVKIHAYYNLLYEQINQLNNNNELFNQSIISKLNHLYNGSLINNQYNLIDNSFSISNEQTIINKSIKIMNNNDNDNQLLFNNWSPDLSYYILTNDLFTISRIFYAFSLFAFYVRLMYIFSFSIVLGPKLIMINRMVIHDLLPFLLILLVCQIGYGIAFQSISFANGYYSDYEQEKMTINSTYQSKPGIRSLYDVIMTSYFQMLGEFRLDDLAGDGSSCRDNGMCPQTSSRRLTIIMLSAFILLTQVLMFNLLVATFTSTYNEIEGSAQYFWCYQRYEMIQEFVDRPSVAAPFMLLWYSVEFTGFLFSLIGGTLFDHAIEEIKDDDPFCRSLHTNPTLDSKLTKWEHMMGTRRIKADTDVGSGRKWTGRSHGDTHAIVLRSVAVGAAGKGLVSGGTSGHRDVTGEPGSLLEGIGPIFGPDTEFIEEKFRELGNQIGKLSTFEERLGKLIQGGNRVISIVKNIKEQQKQIIKSLTPTNGKRLVGWGKSNKKDNKNLLMTAVCAAVTGLDSHCTIIEEKIEEKLRIEEQCVKAILTRSNGDELEVDTVLTPRKGPPSRGPRAAPASGKIYERLILSHRLWRIVPFNFEIFPGIRMNVPHDKINWKIPYDTYRTFTVTDDRIALPYPELEDGPEVSPQTLPYNSYDIVKGVSRMSLRGRVRIVRQTDHITDPRTTNVTSKTAPTKATAKLSEYIPVGYPLNPCGRTGLTGKGLLPHWGPNHCIIIAITRPDPDHRFYESLPLIQVGLLQNNQQLCLPWYLTDHREDCDFQDCSANVIRAFIQRRLMNLFEDKHHQQSMLTSLRAASVSIAYTGYVTDHLNADHAWIEGVLFNIHENEEHPFQQEFLQVFLESETTEQAVWMNIGRLTGIRSSHDELLARIALHRGAFYSEAMAKRQLYPTS
ncbi:putative transient receptor potential cation channel,subfamily m, member [Schistosoma mansoni]|uniref:putative transient receptor potential cation channel,subfamily m, member n=1 Tax=Schistosoma mansoni TaxID=6183 RepID=UPI00022DC77F|nr:putative transient receptor potential cation channel,subfamily m, member [Schistosoma mansoni]|eukprot:XP_018652237.1 putative transient receptor potential cation channel,subfamily m, member [Schistosoma mansoni]